MRLPWFLDGGFWRRREACRLTALAMSSQTDLFGEPHCGHIWGLTVFFECYMAEGADGTQKDFGPKEPVKLSEAKSQREAAA